MDINRYFSINNVYLGNNILEINTENGSALICTKCGKLFDKGTPEEFNKMLIDYDKFKKAFS
jgi:hypothetical protein